MPNGPLASATTCMTVDAGLGGEGIFFGGVEVDGGDAASCDGGPGAFASDEDTSGVAALGEGVVGAMSASACWAIDHVCSPWCRAAGRQGSPNPLAARPLVHERPLGRTRAARPLVYLGFYLRVWCVGSSGRSIAVLGRRAAGRRYLFWRAARPLVATLSHRRIPLRGGTGVRRVHRLRACGCRAQRAALGRS
jgi:hypothetical protein